MSGIEKWSTTPGSNNDVAPDGFPEGMPPSGVNNSAREVMAAVKTWHLDAEWPVYGVNGHANGYSISFVSTTVFKFASTDRRTIVPVGRRVKAGVGAGVIYGTITASTLSASDTQVTVSFDSGSLDSSLSYVALGIISPSNLSLPNNVDSSFSDVTVAGDLSVAGTASLSDLTATGDVSLSDVWITGALSGNPDASLSDVTLAGDLAVNGGDLTSSATTFNLLTSTVTTLNVGSAATNGRIMASGGALGIGVAASGFRQILIAGAFVSSGAGSTAS